MAPASPVAALGVGALDGRCREGQKAADGGIFWPSSITGKDDMAHFVVMECAESAWASTVARRSCGSAVRVGWSGGAGTVCVGTVVTAADASAAVLAAVRGADLVIEARADRQTLDVLYDDLRRLGTLEHVAVPARHGEQLLTGEQQALVDLLVGGSPLGQAARALHISRRTADRRLAAARRALGAATTAEALAKAVQLGTGPAGIGA